MSGPAHVRALERIVARLFGLEGDAHITTPAFRDGDVGIAKAMDAKAMIGVVARQAQLDDRPLVDGNFRVKTNRSAAM